MVPDILPRPLWRRAAVVSVALLVFANDSFGQAPDIRTNAAIRLAAARSDNILRQTVAPQSGGYRGLGFVFDIVRRGARIDGDIQGDVEYRRYSGANISDDRVGSLNASANINVVDNVFWWNFDDNYGQGRTNGFLPASPNNQQDVNRFSTGPRVNVALGDRTYLRFDGTLSRRRFSNNRLLDSDVEAYQLGIFRALSTATEVGISASTREITYDGSAAFSWSLDSLFLSYRRRLASGSASVQIGQSEIDFGAVKTTSPLLDLSWLRDVGARSSITVSAIQGQSDPGDGFVRANTLNNPNAIGGNNAFLGQGVYEFSSFGVSNTISYDRSTFTVSVRVGESTYIRNPNFDNDQKRMAVSFTRNLAERMRIGLNTGIFKREFANPMQDDDGSFGELSFTKQFPRRLSFRFSYTKNARDSGLGQYDENVVRASLTVDLNP